MVERLKKAIAKAHAERLDKEAAGETAAAAPVSAPVGDANRSEGGAKPSLLNKVAEANAARMQTSRPAPDPAARQGDLWASISSLSIDQTAMDRGRVVSFAGQHPARVSFDILRTRVTKLLRENSWSRIAVTSSAKGAGKTFISLNLALSLARNRDHRVMLFDLDLRAPGLSKLLHMREALHLDKLLSGEVEPETYLRRIEDNLLVCLNSRKIPNSAELIQSEGAKEVLDRTIRTFQPTIVIFDLPPLMASDDAIGVLDHVDGALLIAAAGETRTKEIAESEQLILEHTNLLGVILNKGEQTDTEKYYY